MKSINSAWIFTLVLTLAIIAGLLFKNPVLILAQETEAPLYTRAHEIDLSADIDDLQTRLLAQLAQYQQHEREHRIARDQYQKLQTLNSIEEAINASKRAMLSRNQVLNTYLEILRLKLSATEGIEVTHQERALSLLSANKLALNDFEQTVRKSQDREAINQTAAAYQSIGSKIRQDSYYVLNILAIGRIQAVYNSAYFVHQQISTDVEQANSSLNQSQRTRAINEVNKLITQLPPRLESVWQQAEATQASGGSENFYRDLTKELAPIYSRLSQLVSYFEELEGVK